MYVEDLDYNNSHTKKEINDICIMAKNYIVENSDFVLKDLESGLGKEIFKKVMIDYFTEGSIAIQFSVLKILDKYNLKN